MLKWVLYLTLKVFHGNDIEYVDPDFYSTKEKCEREGEKKIIKYNGAMKFKCKLRKV